MSGQYIFNPPPSAPAPAPAPYAQGGQPAYGQHGGGYSHPPHPPQHQHQHQRGPPHRGGHQFAGGRTEYPQGSTPTEYYQQVQYQSPGHASHPPGSGNYGQWPPGQYHQALPHASPPAAAAAPTHSAYPAPYGQPQPSYGASQQGYVHPPAQYQMHYAPAAPYASQPAPSHDQGARPPSGYPGDRTPRPSVAPPGRSGYESAPGPAPGSGPYGHPYPPEHRAPQYGAPPPYPAYAAASQPPFPSVALSFPSRHDSHAGGNNRRGRGSSHSHNGGRGGKFHQPQHNHDRPKQQNHKNVSTAEPAKGNPPPDASLSNKKKKRKMDPLGLKGTGDGSSEDDEDDEARLPKTLGNDGIAFPEDMATWLANRKRNYPTKARIAQKAAEDAERKAAEEAEELKRLEKEAEAKELERQASQLRKQLKKVESSIKRKREQHDDGDDMRESGESESDDEKPEAMSSRDLDASAAAKADVNQPCKYFSTGATCGKGSKCRFVHDQATRDEALREKAANGDKHTIRQRLVLNDKSLEDMDILESIVFLRDRGVEGTESRVKTLAKQQEQSLLKLKPVSSLPAKPPTLPEKPVKKEGSHPKHNGKKEPSIKREHGIPPHQPGA